MKRFALLSAAIWIFAGQVHALDCYKFKRLTVDADGAPDSYRVDGNGLSYTCDGVFARLNGVDQTQKNNPDWNHLCKVAWDAARQTGDYSGVHIVGFDTEPIGKKVKGKKQAIQPVVQGKDDPFPDVAYVSITAKNLRGYKGRQARYVDATQIPYVVMAPGDVKGFKYGDVVAVYRPKTDKVVYAVWADEGDMGEGSVRLHLDLGGNPFIVRDGVKRAEGTLEEAVILLPLVGAHTHPTPHWADWQSEISTVGDTALAAAGGIDAIKSCNVAN